MKKLLFYLLIIGLAGCKEKYDLPFTSPAAGYLVIEGLINTGVGITHIELSRTNTLSSTEKQFVRGAKVQVEGNDNNLYPLSETGIGIYTADLSLNNSKLYRLRIKVNAKEYLSDYVEAKITPPIDSISWVRESNGVQLSINTHDAQAKTRYYKWDYQQTWEFHSPFRSVLKFVVAPGPNGTVSIDYIDPISHLSDTSIYKCWTTTASNQLEIGSSAKLSQDRIFKPFLLIPAGDQRISVLYSINVRQFALTKDCYEFLEKMKKNTEEKGSVFDAQPSQLRGNIRCLSDDSEPIIGFVSASSVQEKRLFIKVSEVSGWNYRSSCEEEPVLNHPDSIKDVYKGGGVPTDILELQGLGIKYFGSSSIGCIDCTLFGTNVKPPFWP